jgi:surface protein
MTDLSKCFCANDNDDDYHFTEIIGLDKWNVRNVTDMHQMFFGCEELYDIIGI